MTTLYGIIGLVGITGLLGLGGIIKLVGYCVLWFFSIIWCAIIARNKNRSILGWILLGLFFSVFAVITLLLLPPRIKQTD